MTTFSEFMVEASAMGWLANAGWATEAGANIAPGGPAAERASFETVVLSGRLRAAVVRLNVDLPGEAIDDALRKLSNLAGVTLLERNRALHRFLVHGVQVEYRTATGEIRGAQVRILDFDDPENNDFLAVNQFTVVQNGAKRRLDVVLFVNGLPLAVLELKNATGENATIASAFNQLQTYQAELPSMFEANEILVISDGMQARVGTIGAGKEWFKPWRTITGQDPASPDVPELQVVIEGLLAPYWLLDMVRDFIVFEDDGARLMKKMAGYHQFHAVRIAVLETMRAVAAGAPEPAGSMAETPGRYMARSQKGGSPGDQRVGVIWHTQGSGKSLTMAFYAGRVIRERAMGNPTIVVLTDRNDLDDQLFATFSRCHELLRQPPSQATSRAELRDLLAVNAGGVVFTTVHKFFPEEKGDRFPLLSDRRNIVVIADEAHRSQYDFVDGYAAHMRDALPNASFIGFTGTPIELADANTRAVFGEYISIYDIRRAVQDGATVPIYYESRLAKLALNPDEKPNIDTDFEEATEGEEVDRKEKLKSKWAQLEAVVGSEHRLKLVAVDIVEHYEKRCEALDGKAMIVVMSRRIAVALHDELIALRPAWQGTSDADGALKVVMTGSASDPVGWQKHIRPKSARENLAQRFRDPNSDFRLVIVRDMWLTGFDAPSLHTMYVDKPMRGHGLMQAIARVNRVFRDKPGGLVVDYLGLAQELKAALATYTREGGEGRAALDQDEAVAVMLEKYEVCVDMLHGFDWSSWFGDGAAKMALLPKVQQHILAQDDGKRRYLAAVRDLSQAFALAVPHDEAMRIRDDLAFFQAVRAVLAKGGDRDAKPLEDLDHAVRQIISRAVMPDGVLDVFAAAGVERPDISILSDEFLAEVQEMPHRNLAVELLEKLLKGEIKARRDTNVVKARSFAEMLEQTLRGYQNRSIEAAQVIEELIALAKEMREADARGEQLGLNNDELAFYDALATNDSAVEAMSDESLRAIARELVITVRNNVSIDWKSRESVRANLRRLVKRILRKYGYPPDLAEMATKTVIEQAEVLSENWPLFA